MHADILFTGSYFDLTDAVTCPVVCLYLILTILFSLVISPPFCNGRDLYLYCFNLVIHHDFSIAFFLMSGYNVYT